MDWMVLMTSGDMTERQMREFDAWCVASPRNAEAWSAMSGALHPFGVLAKAGLPRGTLSRSLSPAGRDRRALLAGFAGLCAVGGTGLFATQRLLPLQDVFSDHFTKTAQQAHLRLEDSTEVVLAPRSALNVAMTPELRSVQLGNGQMMIDAARSDPRPLVVNIERFSLDAGAGAFLLDRRDGLTAVTALRGKGTLRSARGERLTFGMGERLTDAGTGLRRQTVDVDAAASWVTGLLVVNGETVGSIVDRFRPYFAGFIRIGDGAERHATGVFNLLDPVTALSALARSVDLQMTRTAGFWLKIEPRDA